MATKTATDAELWTDLDRVHAITVRMKTELDGAYDDRASLMRELVGRGTTLNEIGKRLELNPRGIAFVLKSGRGARSN